MRKKLVIPVIILGSIFLLTVLLLTYKDLLSQSPFKRSLPIQNLAAITSDSDGNLYMIVAARRNIIKIDKEGNCLYTIEPVGNDKNELYLFSDVVVDRKGYLYVRRTDLDDKGIYVETESVLCYSPTGHLLRELHRVNYDEDKRPLRAGNIKSLQIQDEYLYFHYLQPDRDYLYSISLKDYSINKYIIAYLPPDSYLADITGIYPGAIFYSTQRGEIHRINENGEIKLFYPQEISYFDSAYNTDEDYLWSEQTPDRTFPIQLKLCQDKLYFIDTFANELRCLPTETAESGYTAFSQANLENGGELSVLKDTVICSDNSLIIAVRDRIYELDANGQLINTLTHASQSLQVVGLRFLVWLLPLVLLGLLLYLIRYVYIVIMRRRVSLILKQIIVFTPIVIIAMIILSLFLYQYFADREEEEIYRQLVVLNTTGLNRLEPACLERISSPRDYMNEDYSFLRDLTIEAQIQRGTYGENKLDEAGLYSAVYKLENDKLYAIVDYDNSVNMYRPISIAGEFKQVLDSGQMITDKASDENGSWMFAMAPIFDSNNKIIGIYETGVDRSSFNKERALLFKGIARNIGFITLVTICIFLLMIYYQLLSIRKLRSNVAEIAEGNWEVVVTLDTGDELADLGASVNDMATHIRNYIQEITDLSEAYYRFVPQQFLSLLGKESITDVQLGDQVRQDMSIFTLNIHSFYQLSETMGPEENFNFIKSYLNWMGSVIGDYGGLIDKYTGPGFVALFPDQAGQAVQAAIELRKRLVGYNEGRKRAGYAPINIGIGIHKGPLMLGVIGEKKRLAGTVISDNVNVASFLQLLTGKLACPVIISEQILKALEKPYPYQYRVLGRIRPEGRDEALLLFDVFEGDAEDIRILKLESRELFEEGIELFQKGHFHDARSRFIEVIKINRQDEIARIYFYLCEEYQKNSPPEGWDGTLLL